MTSEFDRSRWVLESAVMQGQIDFRKRHFAERARPPADVFISYSSLDRGAARSFCDELRENGIACFLDEKDLSAGDRLSKKLKEAIRKRSHYLLLLSKNSAASAWVGVECGFAAGSERICRVLRLDDDVAMPPGVADILADSEPAKLIAYYKGQKYDPLSIQIFLRDVMMPVYLSELGNFRPVQGHTSAWEHKEAETWPEVDRKYALDGHYRAPRIARIEVERTGGVPKLRLVGWKNGPIEVAVAWKDDQVALQQWWYIPEKINIDDVHSAFWLEAVDELVRILQGQASVLTSSGIELERLPHVTWWDFKGEK